MHSAKVKMHVLGLAQPDYFGFSCKSQALSQNKEDSTTSGGKLIDTRSARIIDHHCCENTLVPYDSGVLANLQGEGCH